MATITGKRFQITDGASTPTNLFPYTVSEAVYGLSNTISNAISTALSALSLSTYAGTSAIGSSTQPVYYNGSALVATDLSTTYAPYNANGYLPLTGGAMSNTNVVTNLNADLLDGHHDGDLTAIYLKQSYSGTDLASASLSENMVKYAIITGSTDADLKSKIDSFGQAILLSMSWMGVAYGARILYGVNDLKIGFQVRHAGTWQAINEFYHSGNFVAGTNYQTPHTTLAGYGITDWLVKYASTDSPDTFTTSGIYRVNAQTGTSGTGYDFRYGNILVVRGSSSSDTLTQLAFPFNSSNIYFRTGNTSSADFKSNPWKTIWNSGNSNLSTVNWACKTLTASGLVSAACMQLGGYSSRITAAGWYRFYTATSSNGAGNSVILHINRNYSNDNNESYTIAVNIAYNGGISVTQLNGYANQQLITKVRVDYTNSGALYVDFYSEAQSGTGNTVFVTCEGLGSVQAPTAVSSPTGTTKEYALIPNGLATSGNILATGAITAGSASDARLKINIQSLSAEAAKRIVMALNPVTFTWNGKATELYNQYKGDDLGMIAQEVEPYLPQAVGTIFEKYKRLDYTKVISPLVKVAQDHESRIRQLEARVAELEMENKRLRS